MKMRIHILTLSLVFILVACDTRAPTQPATSIAAPSASVSSIDAAQVKAALASTPLPASPAEAEKLILVRLRSQVRSYLGAGADDLFNRVDAAEQAVASQAIKGLPEPPGSQPTPSAFSASPASFQGHYALASFPASPPRSPHSQVIAGGAMTMLSLFVVYANIPEDTPFETTQTVNEQGVQAEIKVKISRQGCILRADVKAQATVRQNGLAVKETTVGSVEVQLCPDSDGKVPASYGLDWEEVLTENGVELTSRVSLAGTSEGQVNDNANLVSVANELTNSLDTHTVGIDPKYIGDAEVTLTWVSSENDANGLPSDFHIEGKMVESGGSQSDSRNPGGAAAVIGLSFVRGVVQKAYEDASKQWQNGYCLEVAFDGLNSAGDYQDVDPGSTTPFTARVRHKFERQDLPLPLVGTLNGEKSLEPGGTNQAPVKYTYQAPDAGNQYANSTFETRSRRGVAKGLLNFKVLVYALTLNGTVSNAFTYGGACSGSITFQFSLKLSRGTDTSGDETFEGKGPLSAWSGSAACPLCSYSGNGAGAAVSVDGIIRDGVLNLHTLEILVEDAPPSENGHCNLDQVWGVGDYYGNPVMPLELKDGSSFHLTFDAGDRYSCPTQQTIDLSLQVQPVK